MLSSLRSVVVVVLVFSTMLCSGICALGQASEDGIGLQWGLEAKWAFNTSDQFPNQIFGAGHQGCFTVWDVDGDNKKEIIFGTRQRGYPNAWSGPENPRRLWCIEEDGTFQWIYPPLEDMGLPGDPTSKVSLIDVNNDGTYELCFAGRGGRLHVLNGDGSVKWTWDNPNAGIEMHGPPQALDVDGDGFAEFFMNDGAGFIHRVDHLGNLVWSIESGGENEGYPTIADMDRDGRYEVLWASQDHYLYCAAADDGSMKWQFNTNANMQTNPVIVADVNGDDQYEAVVWSDAPSSAVFIVDHDGTELSRWVHPRGVNLRLGQAMGDVDGDGRLEIATMTGSGGFLLDMGGQQPFVEWELNFTQLSEEGRIPPGATSDPFSSYQLIADIDGDQALEILWQAPYPIVTDAVTGRVEAYYLNEHIAIYGRAENGGWWGDADGDGVSEWIVELHGKSHPETMIYALTMRGEFPAQAPWPEYHHSAYPAKYQAEEDWLTLKAAYSNSQWFPICQDLYPDLWDTVASKFPLARSHIDAAKRKGIDQSLIDVLELEYSNAEKARDICDLGSAQMHLDWIIAFPEPYITAAILLLPIYATWRRRQRTRRTKTPVEAGR